MRDTALTARAGENRKCVNHDLCLDIGAFNNDRVMPCKKCIFNGLQETNELIVAALICSFLKEPVFKDYADKLLTKHTQTTISIPGRVLRRASERPTKVSVLRRKKAIMEDHLWENGVSPEKTQGNTKGISEAAAA